MDKPKTRKQRPPVCLHGEALLEWHRVVDELLALNIYDRADRAILIHHCRIWATLQVTSSVVASAGPVVELPNKWQGASPEYKALVELTKLDAALLAALGLTPAARRKLVKPAEEIADDDAITY